MTRASAALRIETTLQGPAFVLALGGRLGVAEAPAVRRALRKAVTEPVDLVVCELSGLTWIHPACLALLSRRRRPWPGRRRRSGSWQTELIDQVT